MKPIDFLDDVNSKYSLLECDLEHKLKKISLEEQKFEKQQNNPKHVTFQNAKNTNNTNKFCENLESAQKRNTDLIKNLEIAKARLRSRAIYSPIEQVLSKAISEYESNNRSLIPISGQKTYGPTFV